MLQRSKLFKQLLLAQQLQVLLNITAKERNKVFDQGNSLALQNLRYKAMIYPTLIYCY